MRNLVLLGEQALRGDGDAVASGLDADGKVFYFASSDNVVSAMDIESRSVGLSVPLSLAPDAKITGLQYCAELEAVCVSSTSGELALIRTATEEVEVVGDVAGGIVSMAWSPDQELVVLATSSGNMLLMTKEFDLVTEQPLVPDASHDAPAVSSAAVPSAILRNKAASAAAAAAASTVSTEAGADSGSVTISWRGDGQFFATNSFDTSTGTRVIRVWTRAGQIHSKSELQSGVSDLVAWRPSGELLASTQRRPNSYDVILYEKNGLRHGEFSLRWPGFSVQNVDKGAQGGDAISVVAHSLVWSNSGDVLAVVLRRPGTAGDLVQLYYRNNYHWYLKFEVRLNTVDEHVVQVSWDPVEAHRLWVALSSGAFHSYDFCWDTVVSAGPAPGNDTTVAVIDGCDVLLTPMRRAVVPPPMSATKVTLPESVNLVTFAPDLSMVAVTARNTLALFASPSSPFDAPVLQGIAVLESILHPSTSHTLSSPARHVCMLSADRVLAVASTESQGDTIVDVKLVRKEKESLIDTHVLGHMPLHGRTVLRMHHSTVSGRVFVQYSGGEVMEYIWSVTDTALRELQKRHTLPSPAPWFSSVEYNGTEATVALTRRNKLYLDTTLIANDCTSFSTHNISFLVYSSLAHVLHFIALDDGTVVGGATTPSSTQAMPVAKNTTPGQQKPFEERSTERGTLVVAAVAQDNRVVLQMPRGNLEVIAPRALVLANIREALDRRDYQAAFKLMRVHRIDLNLLYDHNPAQFAGDVAEVVKQLGSPDYVNLFLSTLRDEDVTVAQYPRPWRTVATPSHHAASVHRNHNEKNIPLSGASKPESSQAAVVSAQDGGKSNKVNTVCHLMRSVLERVDAAKYVLSILTTYVRQSPPDLEAALRHVRTLREKELAPVDASSVPDETASEVLSADAALEYVIFLADVNRLYDAALGMYDFDLVMMVAQKSTKDPKEYLPFLKRLREMEEHYQKYSIDMYVKRYDRALQNLSKAGEQYSKDCLELVRNYKLFTTAAEIYKNNEPMLTAVLLLYGDHLVSENRYEDAGVQYVCAGALDRALNAAKQCGDWRLAVSCAQQLAYSEQDTVELSNELVVVLQTQGRLDEAAVVLEQYCGSVVDSINALISSHSFVEAYRCIIRHTKTAMLEDKLRPGLISAYDHFIADIRERSVTLEAKARRLDIVRTTKLLAPRVGGGVGDGFSDTASVVSGFSSASSMDSAVSSSSRGSRASTRHSRREERKRVKGREGTKYEEEGLIDALKKLVPTPRVQNEIKETVKGLMLFKDRQRAASLQDAFQQYIVQIKAEAEKAPPALPPIQTIQPVVGGGDGDEDDDTRAETGVTEAQASVPAVPAIVFENPLKGVLVEVDWRLSIL